MTTMGRESPDLRAGLDLYLVVGTSKLREDAGHHEWWWKGAFGSLL